MATSNPKPEYDKPLKPEEAVLRTNKFSGCIAAAQEWRMNQTLTHSGQPNELTIYPTCNSLNNFVSVFKLLSNN